MSTRGKAIGIVLLLGAALAVWAPQLRRSGRRPAQLQHGDGGPRVSAELDASPPLDEAARGVELPADIESSLRVIESLLPGRPRLRVSDFASAWSDSVPEPELDAYDELASRWSRRPAAEEGR